MVINLILLSGLVIAALWTVMTIRLLRSVVGLAITSAILSIIIYRLQSPLAAVFELSVCAGLISVIFITTVSFTHRLTPEALRIRRKERLVKFWLLPFVMVGVAFFLVFYTTMDNVKLPLALEAQDVRAVIWNMRHLDLLGQIVILLTGVFGVVVLFKETK